MRVCRECGCTEYDACVYSDGQARFPCFWVESDLCSFCALPFPEDADREKAPMRGVDVVIAAGGVL